MGTKKAKTQLERRFRQAALPGACSKLVPATVEVDRAFDVIHFVFSSGRASPCRYAEQAEAEQCERAGRPDVDGRVADRRVSRVLQL